VDTTTISHTFSQYNVAATIYIIGPMSLVFIFRFYRTVNDHDSSVFFRKHVFFALLCSQYTSMIIIRYDAIQGMYHYIFTAATFLLLLGYHNCIGGSCRSEDADVIMQAKTLVSCISFTLMTIFGIIQTVRPNLKVENASAWSAVCVLEVVAVFGVGIPRQYRHVCL